LRILSPSFRDLFSSRDPLFDWSNVFFPTFYQAFCPVHAELPMFSPSVLPPESPFFPRSVKPSYFPSVLSSRTTSRSLVFLGSPPFSFFFCAGPFLSSHPIRFSCFYFPFSAISHFRPVRPGSQASHFYGILFAFQLRPILPFSTFPLFW